MWLGRKANFFDNKYSWLFCHKFLIWTRILGLVLIRYRLRCSSKGHPLFQPTFLCLEMIYYSKNIHCISNMLSLVICASPAALTRHELFSILVTISLLCEVDINIQVNNLGNYLSTYKHSPVMTLVYTRKRLI